MGLFSSIAKIGRAVGSVAGSVARSPIGKIATSVIPGAGLVVGGLQLASAGQDIYSGFTGGGGRGAGLPALPGGGGMMPAMANAPMVPAGGPDVGMGNRSIFRNDPNVAEALKPYAIPMRDLRTYHRAPKGFVIVRDAKGDPYGLPKQLARAYGLWKPSAKPPISATDWKAFKRAASVSKKLNKIHAQGQKYLTRKSSSSRRSIPANYTIVESGSGGVKVGGRKKC